MSWPHRTLDISPNWSFETIQLAARHGESPGKIHPCLAGSTTHSAVATVQFSRDWAGIRGVVVFWEVLLKISSSFFWGKCGPYGPLPFHLEVNTSFVVEGVFYPFCWEKPALFNEAQWRCKFFGPAQVVCHDKTFCTDILEPFLYLPSCLFLESPLFVDVFLTGKGCGCFSYRRGNWSLTHEGWLASTKSFTTGMGVWLQWQRRWLRSLDFSSLEKGEQFFFIPLELGDGYRHTWTSLHFLRYFRFFGLDHNEWSEFRVI